MSELDRLVLNTHMRRLKGLKDKVEMPDAKIASIASQSEDTRLLMTLTGIDYHSTFLIASEIGDIRRFPSPRHYTF